MDLCLPPACHPAWRRGCTDRGGFTPHIIHREKEIQTLLLMISAGMGIAVLPEYCVRYYVRAKNLKILRLVTEEGSPESMNFEISWKRDNTNPAVLQLLNWIKFRKATE
ncbi:MAG: LysR substrate-binding domain-containing protein [Lachnospiraceae bacterium]|nr:LysR substrate-binding domain-containing protein [Lachnospiraceae bacterium]